MWFQVLYRFPKQLSFFSSNRPLSHRCTIPASEWSLCSSQPSVRPQPSKEQVELGGHVRGNVSAFIQRRPTKRRCR